MGPTSGLGVEEYKTIISALVACVIAGGGLFLTVVGWIGKQMLHELKSISAGLGLTNEKLAGIEKDLRKDLSHLDRRVTRVEAWASTARTPEGEGRE